MVDHVTSIKRSEIMRAVKRAGSAPEIVVRRLVWALGYRYRLNVKTLPGRPDIVLRRYRKAIFVHGCFWHGHVGCSKAKLPKSNTDYWSAKIAGNKRRDSEQIEQLRQQGWKVLTVWQCELRDEGALLQKLKEFLGED
ncbi:DNA mismatch endonuclease Vsr [Burkholderia cepacia]|uniref:very short patch repair endonuclease n=1 Tax=Burkholderia cepacia TaxID=292 RepID=UPI00157A39BD|nr:very short patch repair endonuclease [Burkholderia cepacia]NTX45182.1 DNA mismatch endonuclease Vsr [Burkholderia cepacia]